jgi:hypothetical protein
MLAVEKLNLLQLSNKETKEFYNIDTYRIGKYGMSSCRCQETQHNGYIATLSIIEQHV